MCNYSGELGCVCFKFIKFILDLDRSEDQSHADMLHKLTPP